MKNVDRRYFITVAGKAMPVLVGVPYFIACGSDRNPVTGPSTDDGASAISAVSSVNSGHTHSAQIPAGDVDSTDSVSYESSSTGGHTHTVTFTESDFEELRDNGEVTVASSSDSGHAHTFTFRS